jgi:hypothetical protein
MRTNRRKQNLGSDIDRTGQFPSALIIMNSWQMPSDIAMRQTRLPPREIHRLLDPRHRATAYVRGPAQHDSEEPPRALQVYSGIPGYHHGEGALEQPCVGFTDLRSCDLRHERFRIFPE